MTNETPAEQQYREAVEALKKMEPWRLAEIRREMGITKPEPGPEPERYYID